jgi:hypothetical protein
MSARSSNYSSQFEEDSYAYRNFFYKHTGGSCLEVSTITFQFNQRVHRQQHWFFLLNSIFQVILFELCGPSAPALCFLLSGPSSLQFSILHVNLYCLLVIIYLFIYIWALPQAQGWLVRKGEAST